MLTGIHFLLTYTCIFECDHCFLYCSPSSQGTFTIDQVDQVLEEAKKTSTIEWIFFEGGEPLLFYPLLKEAVKRASASGFKVGIVTNAYGIKSKADARLWFEPLSQAGLTFLSLSNDTFHFGDRQITPAIMAHEVAMDLNIDTSLICITPPSNGTTATEDDKGKPVEGGTAMFRGRAVEKLTPGLPVKSWKDLASCPYEDLKTPSRVHIDAYGHVHVCQGISMGNMWETPLSRLIDDYDPVSHPICGPLIQNGPAGLVRYLDTEPTLGFVDECHLCFSIRKSIIEKFPDRLAPRQVYGLPS